MPAWWSSRSCRMASSTRKLQSYAVTPVAVSQMPQISNERMTPDSIGARCGVDVRSRASPVRVAWGRRRCGVTPGVDAGALLREPPRNTANRTAAVPAGVADSRDEVSRNRAPHRAVLGQCDPRLRYLLV